MDMYEIRFDPRTTALTAPVVLRFTGALTCAMAMVGRVLLVYFLLAVSGLSYPTHEMVEGDHPLRRPPPQQAGLLVDVVLSKEPHETMFGLGLAGRSPTLTIPDQPQPQPRPQPRPPPRQGVPNRLSSTILRWW